MKTYRKLGATSAASIYMADDKEKLILVPVNREYSIAKRPVFYLKRKRLSQKPQYLSGLFPTKDPAVFSGDVKNPITGIKQLFSVTFKEGGNSIELEGLK